MLMAKLCKSELQIHNVRSINQEILDIDDFVSINDEILKQEKAYQRLINEKLKSALEWHIRDSKSFSIG